jgi:hypothetical protein
MRQLSLIVLGLLLGALLLPLTGHAQEPDQPLVLFLEDKQSATASIQDTGPDGISELEQIFKNLGARTGWGYLNDPIPEEAHVVVIVRPLQPLAVPTVARLWAHVLRGNHLLLTLDPIGPATYRGEGSVKSNPDRANAGLPTLLWLVYGIGLQDTLVAEPWFSTTSVADDRTLHLVAYPEDIVQHPVVAPMSPYGLPVQVWGARSLRVEPIGPHSYAVPLLYTQTAFGESNPDVFKTQAPVELNLGPDAVGRLLVGALGENTLTGSRVVVLGDSESLENGYGLVKWQGTEEPIHMANRVFAERLAAWLLDRPVDEWASLPAGYTWLALDGNGSDWADRTEIIQDDTGDALVPRYDIQSLHMFRDDRFFYALVELTGPPSPDVRLTMGFENTYDGMIDVTVALTPDQAWLLDPQGGEPRPILDADMAVGAAIEVRLPVRIAGEGALAGTVCLADSRTPLSSPPIDCAMPVPAVIPVANTVSPVDTWYAGPQAIVDTLEAGVNVRSVPGTDTRVLATAYNGQVFAAIGRTALGDWIQVQNAAYTGWLASFLVKTNIDIGELPIVTP